ncbi:YegP family protein (plasmid) [Photobacterium sp. GJ3]|nr:YegP family protein [Photobacterium sp. GJ3]QUJ69889.1 YegP family protein [Photobacterium sp. GJ3]
MDMGSFELKKAKNDQIYFVLKAANGEVILKSEMYTTKAAAQNGIKSVQTNSPDAGLYDLKEAANGQFHFNLKAKNHQIIGSSEMYKSKSGAENGIKSVQKNGPTDKIKDLTV